MSKQDPNAKDLTEEDKIELAALLKATQERAKRLVHSNMETKKIQAQFKEELEEFLNPENWRISAEDMADILEGKAQELRSAKLRVERSHREAMLVRVGVKEPVPVQAAAPPRAKLSGWEKPLHSLPTDAPTCTDCGSLMEPNGSCYKCTNCGSTSGCS